MDVGWCRSREVAEPGLLEPHRRRGTGLQGADRPWRVDTLADYLADRTALLVLDNCEQLLGRGRRSRAGTARSLPERQVPADQQAAATAERRGRDRGATARPSRRGDRRHPGDRHPLRGGQPVRGPRHVGTLRLRADGGQRTSSRRTLVRDLDGRSAGHRAGCRPGPGDVTAGDLRQPHRATPGAHHRATGTPTTGTSRCGPASSGPTSCARTWSSGSGHGRRCSPAATTWTPRPPSARPTTCRAGEILDLVSALVDQSILIAEAAALGHTRYRMLTDIRQFGLERAEKDGELHGMQERHATWCAELVSVSTTEAGGPHQPEWLRLLRLEQANLRTALELLRRGGRGRRRRLGDGPQARPVLVCLRVARRGPPLAGARRWPREPGRLRSEASRWPLAARFAVLQNDRSRPRGPGRRGDRGRHRHR